MKRYEIRTGKFGQYFYDSVEKREMSLAEVEDALNEEVSKKEGETYVTGDRFEEACGGVYILAQPNVDEVCLINLNDGNRWTEPKKVKDIYKITEKELNEVSGETGKFTKVERSS